jgi:hypothetical protein
MAAFRDKEQFVREEAARAVGDSPGRTSVRVELI